ncbi:hypothetical protein DMH04_29605 [Kibdelosporangium aridum]|uniref:Uncharacterized protein n=1 Tax=Kibdelosporangium aridum TaxID=2030 RepID=A0A428Z3P0_KIBAR|nr:hypothetical protein [Kibdelosporangium aridum]RSM80687.1 hypothetical protein DMH04_29605 [Kibdelosporangium aridum]
MDWFPFRDDEVRIDLMCRPGPQGWEGQCVISVQADALRRLGLHPDQPTSRIVGSSPWWPR